MDYFRMTDNTPRAAYSASRNHVSGQQGHLSDYATTRELAAWASTPFTGNKELATASNARLRAVQLFGGWIRRVGRCRGAACAA